MYDLRTNQHFTLKQNPLRREHLQESVDCYLSGSPASERVENERFRSFAYNELVARDKVNLDIVWLRDLSLADVDNLPGPEIIALEIVEDLQAALLEFATVADALEATASTGAGDLMPIFRARSEQPRAIQAPSHSLRCP